MASLIWACLWSGSPRWMLPVCCVVAVRGARESWNCLAWQFTFYSTCGIRRRQSSLTSPYGSWVILGSELQKPSLAGERRLSGQWRGSQETLAWAWEWVWPSHSSGMCVGTFRACSRGEGMLRMTSWGVWGCWQQLYSAAVFSGLGDKDEEEYIQ